MECFGRIHEKKIKQNKGKTLHEMKMKLKVMRYSEFEIVHIKDNEMIVLPKSQVYMKVCIACFSQQSTEHDKAAFFCSPNSDTLILLLLYDFFFGEL